MATKEQSTRVPTINAEMDNGILALTFSNGASIRLNPSDLNDDVRHAAMLHGLKQKLVDAAAISRDPATGRSATVEVKYLAVKEVFDRLLAGQWNKPREGGAGATGGLLFAALVRLYAGRKTEQQIREYLDGLSDAEQAALRSAERVAPIIAQIKAERDAKKSDGVDTDKLLAGLDDGD